MYAESLTHSVKTKIFYDIKLKYSLPLYSNRYTFNFTAIGLELDDK